MCIYETDSSSLESRQKSKYITKYENVCAFNGNEASEGYLLIGEYVYVESDIPLTVIEEVDVYKEDGNVVVYQKQELCDNN